jgi:hypothetical protein
MNQLICAAIGLIALSTVAVAQPSSPPAGEGLAASRAEMQELLQAAKETAKASRENVDYSRTVPDILFQILTKLDKVEDKLDRIETQLKLAQRPKR